MQQELRQKRENRRRRHYSLEEFAPECEDSNSSSNFCNSPKLLPIHGEESSESAKEKNDLNPIKSFMFGK